ncbi:MAG: hypothetical protein A2504_13595 [Bdellovibrionales bacterium RIFOXYD12_FULL_39_22]|nr:MAG: hypothetical protein A2385_00320 [Bdellovibrionales bacterium RIFOXYB1_FULL_39_21]OFZ43878.1 MAG: hypothetical protein A2485_05210 [Bdellovibrionales bacterium RIFOXYC12_FULL_39_17]OFZ48788.1 MAG: hypothetical protein A2404_17635 [Bdellovibrionales bacterium RIFOXYC1_FULL_39_130]OFZ76521.1 MAG: hypothetical protein A2560_06300 [Bdellovibrionales bacterium RIFOXYD1_FULL_39_84]OFZ94755.1 MAG: hypothetical protein A2504_13595 [Bdellovibrionales bacterium RIFOXYD12_FULL_39_22]HLE12178.1 ra
MKTFCVVPSAHACTELVVETNQLRTYMKAANFEEIDNKLKSDAEYILVATCAFNQEFENEAFANITSAIKQKRADAKVIVSGCYPKIAPLTYKSFANETVDIPPLNMKKIETIVPAKVAFNETIPNTVNLHEYLKDRVFAKGIKLKNFCRTLNKILPFNTEPKWLDSLPMTDWYFIQGGNGCLGKCTFCAIKHARGGIQSVGIDQIIPQVEKAVRRGYQTISFAATDMGCWGAERGQTLADLLKEVIKVKGDFVVDMHYFEPEWLIKNLGELTPVFQSGKIKSFGTPVQSGSNKILEKMGRAYKIEEFISAVNFVLEKTKVRSLNSIIMVGFPSETVEDYLASYNLINKVKVSYWCLLKYEGRYKVESELLPDKVSEEIKNGRLERIKLKAMLRNYVGLPDLLTEKMVSAKYGPVR